MSDAWTEERRAAHRLAIQTWKPWTKATGPRTQQGKLRASLNALRHGRRRGAVRRCEALLRHHRRWLELVRAHFERHIFSPNELLKLGRLLPPHDPKTVRNLENLREKHEVMLHLATAEP